MYEEYERSVWISDHGQSMQQYLHTNDESLSQYIQIQLAGMFFHETELSDDQLMEALGCCGGCWGEVEVNPPEAATEHRKDGESVHSTWPRGYGSRKIARIPCWWVHEQ